MTATTAVEPPLRRPSWRRPQSAGFGTLGTVGSLIGLAVVILAVVIMSPLIGSFIGGVVVLVLGMVGLALLASRDQHNTSRIQKLNMRVMHAWAARTGFTDYLSGPLSRLGTYLLPGLAARSELTEWEAADGSLFALVRVPTRSGATYAVTIEARPDAATLTDADDLEQMKALWSEYLEALAPTPSLVQMMVTIGTAPPNEDALAASINQQIDRTAPPVAVRLAKAIGGSYPKGGADVQSWVTLTFAGAHRSGVRDARRMGTDLADRLPGIVTKLSATGAGQCTLVHAQDLTDIVRACYDPKVFTVLRRIRRQGGKRLVCRWENVGPAVARDLPTMYLHGDAASVTWTMSDLGEVTGPKALALLMQPAAEIDHKRVSLIFHIHRPGPASVSAERDVNATTFRHDAKHRSTARARKDMRSAEVVEEQVADGATLVDVGMVVTATQRERRVDPNDPDSRIEPAAERILDAALAIEEAAGRVALRREDFTQAASFQLGMPCLGLDASQFVKVPTALTEDL